MRNPIHPQALSLAMAELAPGTLTATERALLDLIRMATVDDPEGSGVLVASGRTLAERLGARHGTVWKALGSLVRREVLLRPVVPAGSAAPGWAINPRVGAWGVSWRRDPQVVLAQLEVVVSRSMGATQSQFVSRSIERDTNDHWRGADPAFRPVTARWVGDFVSRSRGATQPELCVAIDQGERDTNSGNDPWSKAVSRGGTVLPSGGYLGTSSSSYGRQEEEEEATTSEALGAAAAAVLGAIAAVSGRELWGTEAAEVVQAVNGRDDVSWVVDGLRSGGRRSWREAKAMAHRLLAAGPPPATPPVQLRPWREVPLKPPAPLDVEAGKAQVRALKLGWRSPVADTGED